VNSALVEQSDAVKQSNSYDSHEQFFFRSTPAGVLVVEHAFQPDFAEQFLEA